MSSVPTQTGLTPVNGMERLAEGKTKIIYADAAHRGQVLIRSKDDITAGDGARHDVLAGKASLATTTTCRVFELLEAGGVATHFLGQVDPVSFRARRCKMVPLEVVVRRVATGSYLKRHPEVAQGTRFVPPVLEFFFKDDAQHDPLISEPEILRQKLLTLPELQQARLEAVRVFEILERAWALQDVVLVDEKVEFGRIEGESPQLLLADVIDNDSWRIWPHGDPAAMKDKQVYRNLQDRTPDALDAIVANYRWVAEHAERFRIMRKPLVVIFMGSTSDEAVGRQLERFLETFGVESQLRVCSAHKSPQRLLALTQDYDAQARPMVYLAVAGRSNGLGPVLDGATPHPVINCPPPSDRFAGLDILSSLRLPGGLGCTTALEPETAALAAVKMLATHDPALWGRLRRFQQELESAVEEADLSLHNPTHGSEGV